MKMISMFLLYALFDTHIVSTMERILESTRHKIDIKKEYIQCLPQDVQLVIVKKVCWLRWHNEIVSLEKYMPLTIGIKQLSSIDLWKISKDNRKKILEQNKKIFYTMNDYNELTNLLSAEQKQGLAINRLALNDEVYNDCCGIPGGKKYYSYLITPAIVAPLSAAIGGGIGCGGAPIWVSVTLPILMTGVCTTVASIFVYCWDKARLEQNSITMTFEEV